MTDEATPRQIVICCDGTNNNLTGQSRDTNVVKLCQLIADDDDDHRVLFYDPGVGNPGEMPGATVWDNLRRRAERIAGLAFGRGVYENIAECYLFLMRHHRPGDQIYVFGFSRGAFTARSVAGLINQFGVLLPHMESLVPTLMHLYFSDRITAKQQIADITRQATTLFASRRSRRVEIHYVGVWDTVASVGMWPFAAKFTAIPTISKKRFLNVRQALALDEHRAQFSPRLYVDENGSVATDVGGTASIKQLWFRGAHCDVGGGYAAGATAISDAAFSWLVSEAVQCGLRLRANGTPITDEANVSAALHATYPASTNSVVHSELYNTCLWALTGMAVRETRRIVLDDGDERIVTPAEHSSVAAQSLAMPGNTSWGAARPKVALIWCLLFIPLVVIALGQMLTQQVFVGDVVQDIVDASTRIPEYLKSNFAFSRWQIFWWLDGSPDVGLTRFWAPRWAVVWDFALIGLYAYALAWFSTEAFARHAGLRRISEPAPLILKRLGWALPLMVFGDVAENIATWLTVTLVYNELFALAFVSATLMTLCATSKWIGLAGTLVLCLLPRVSLRSRMQ